MKRKATILCFTASFAFGALPKTADASLLPDDVVCTGGSSVDAVPGCGVGDVKLAVSSFPRDATATPCLPEERIRLVSRADGKVFMVINDFGSPSCALQATPSQPRIYAVRTIDVDPNRVWKHFVAGEVGDEVVYSVRDGAAVLREKGRATRGIDEFAFLNLSSRVGSVVILENRCRKGGQTPEDTFYLVAPLTAGGVVINERYKDAPDDCRTVAEFSTAAHLSSAQIRGYLSLVNGTTRVQSYTGETVDGILLLKTYLQLLDEHMVEVEKRLPALRAFPSETWKPYAAWSTNLVRKAIADVYWEALLEPEHLAGGQWPALERAVEAIRVYFEKLADSTHEIEKREGVPKADVEALAKFAADEKVFWEALQQAEAVHRLWLLKIVGLREKVMEYYP